jgi:hypothetical protein
VVPINRMLALLEWFMTERWMSLPRSPGCCIQVELNGFVKTNFGGLPPKDVCSLLDPTIVSCTAMITLISFE